MDDEDEFEIGSDYTLDFQSIFNSAFGQYQTFDTEFETELDEEIRLATGVLKMGAVMGELASYIEDSDIDPQRFDDPSHLKELDAGEQMIVHALGAVCDQMEEFAHAFTEDDDGWNDFRVQ
jgi:hypothetical protein